MAAAPGVRLLGELTQLALDEIQGNVLPGFPHAERVALFLRVVNVRTFLRAVAEIVPRVASARAVLARKDSGLPAINLAFGFDLLARFRADADAFRDEPFRLGLACRSPLLGDPVDASAQGSPANWLAGGHSTPIDAVVLVGANSTDAAARGTDDLIEHFASAAVVVLRQHAARLPGQLPLREHFGFRDEISQPQVRGLASIGDLVWPGEFVFGYPTQSPSSTDEPGPDRLASDAPPWARNGSFVVIRRLRQDVAAFHQFARRIAKREGMAPELVCARLVGRWPSGAPLVLFPDCDPGGSSNDAFTYQGADSPGARPPSDPDAVACPASAHTRKVNPRGVRSLNGNVFPNAADTQRHRILRRGVAYGPVSPSTPSAPSDDGVDRGLLFLCYQTSIERQFEFIQRRWANESNFPEPLSGYDPLIGQRSDRGPRRFHVGVCPDATVETSDAWVTPTGGGYFFAPSITALEVLAS